jgi:putative transposase
MRLKDYDYSKTGLYFITICCQNMEHRFGEIIQIDENKDALMKFNDAGEMINREWVNLKDRFQNIELHEFQTMPNHFHGIVEIIDSQVGADPCGRPETQQTQIDLASGRWPQDSTPIVESEKPKSKSICDMIDAFKSITTLEYIRGVEAFGWERFEKKIWQRSFHDHIIRNEAEYFKISNYIQNNPLSWSNDKFNNK